MYPSVYLLFSEWNALLRVFTGIFTSSHQNLYITQSTHLNFLTLDSKRKLSGLRLMYGGIVEASLHFRFDWWNCGSFSERCFRCPLVCQIKKKIMSIVIKISLKILPEETQVLLKYKHISSKQANPIHIYPLFLLRTFVIFYKIQYFRKSTFSKRCFEFTREIKMRKWTLPQ